MTRPYVEERTPDRWTLATTDAGEWDTDPRYVWEYDPRPRLKVAVRTEHPASKWTHRTPTYLTEIQGPLTQDTYQSTSTGCLPHVDIAEQLMRGVDGVTAPEVRHRLGISMPAARVLSSRIRTWSDLEDLHKATTGFTHLDGVGNVTNTTLEQALDAEIGATHDVVVVRDEAAAADMDAVYVAVACVDGWRVQKRWQQGDDANASVMLPTENPIGDLYETLPAAKQAAESFAQENAGNRDDATANETTADRDSGQAEIERWA